MQKVLVWDWPVRLGHWLMAGAFALAWLTSESEPFRLAHAVAGATVVGVASFRIPWGIFGTRYARFADFVHGPRTVKEHLIEISHLNPEHHIGHNPAGGWAILLLLALGILTGMSGWAADKELGGHWLEEGHEILAATMLCVVMIHVCGVLFTSLLHGENLISSMLNGHKLGQPDEAIETPRPLFTVVLLIWVGMTVWIMTR